MSSVQESIEKGLAYLRAIQLADGSFTGQSSRAVEPFKPVYTYRTTFVPALILGALAEAYTAEDIRQPLANWLLQQRSPTWSFNYWAADAPQRCTMPYPDDLDDTFCSLIGLYRHDPKTLSAPALSAVVKILLAAEAHVGGPYRTWLTDSSAPDSWKDIDLAVNGNVAYFLTLVADPLPNLTALMDAAIASDRFYSPYYPSPLPVLYYLARAYRGDQRAALMRAITNEPARTPLDHALRAAALLHLDPAAPVQADVRSLLQAQQHDGSWPAATFCLDAARQSQRFYHGSAALTTALAIEALHMHMVATSNPATKNSTDTTALVTQAIRNFEHLDTDIRSQCTTMIHEMVRRDQSGEILMFPQLFAVSLVEPTAITAAQLAELSMANLYGWMAYTIYDNFLDNEGDPALLPAATLALRASLRAFQSIPDKAFQEHVAHAFDTIDAANTWEVMRARCSITKGRITVAALPKYGSLTRLADRSLGHTLTPIAVLTLAGIPPQDPKTTRLQEALRHYLIARQLLDDIRDWQEDLRAGRITPVIADVLRAARIKPGGHELTALLPRLQRSFWHEVLPTVCTRVERHIASTRRLALDTKLLTAHSPFFTLIDRLEGLAYSIRSEQKQTIEFLAAYKKPSA